MRLGALWVWRTILVNVGIGLGWTALIIGLDNDGLGHGNSTAFVNDAWWA